MALIKAAARRRRPSIRHYDSAGSRVFDVLNVLILLSLAAITVLPLLYVFAGSFATESEIDSRPFFLWPEKFVTDAYDYMFSTDTFIRALLTTIVVTAVGTLVQVALTLTMAYPLSKRHLPGRVLLHQPGPLHAGLQRRHDPDLPGGARARAARQLLGADPAAGHQPVLPAHRQGVLPGAAGGAGGGGTDRRLQRARRVLADRAAAVQARHRDVLAVLRGRHLERLHVAAALHQRREQVDAAGAGPPAHRAELGHGERAEPASISAAFPCRA